MLNEYRFGDIYIRHAIDECPDDEEFTMHIHEQCEIYFFISGDVDYMVEGKVYPLEENTVMIMKPAEVHKPKIIGKSTYERYAINFPLNFMAEMDPKSRLTRAFTERPLGTRNCYNSSSIDTTLVKLLFSQMFQEYADDYDKLLSIKSHIIALLDIINRAFDINASDSDKPKSTAEKIVAYVNNHIYESLTIPELASHFYLSTSQFNRIFRQATGASPWEYITKKRLTAAKEKIHNGSLALTAAESCGFKDYSSFYRAYTKYFKSSPTENQ